MKDNFSGHADDYAKYRPSYPDEVYEFLKKNLSAFDKAWDCATGNGQVAKRLSEFFKHVEATDISSQQMTQAFKRPNINYSVQPAENVSFNNASFDLVIVGQAVHWFRFEKFYSEVKRCLKPDGMIVLMGYQLLSIDSETDKVIRHFYDDVIGSYWDEERRYLDENYRTIPFPFTEMKTPEFQITYSWTIEYFLGYLRTWSAVKHYENANQKDPVQIVENDLRKSFGKENQVTFPIIFRAGRL